MMLPGECHYQKHRMSTMGPCQPWPAKPPSLTKLQPHYLVKISTSVTATRSKRIRHSIMVFFSASLILNLL
ncbi:hypothetical protein BX600DRAFT_253567 [Xylariales sp. PMI_506]|nr:hypothetical protein BX600DRAFT_253567 [Xylariales sp. PMI_506]